jgi:tetratricopeptide (TPR) repeat protein
MFKHGMTQDAAYQSLLVKQRREIHRTVAQAYEQIFADRCMDEYAAILARHYAEAGDDAQTMRYAIHAGNVAARTYANAEAILFYTQAIDIAKRARGAPLKELYLKRGRVYELINRHDQALTNYADLESHARACGDGAMELAALMARATIYSIPSKQSDRTLAQTLCKQALEIARAIGDQPAQAKILWNILLLNTRLRTNYREGIEYGEQGLAIARQLGLREQTAYLLNDLSLPYTYAGDPERGIALNLEAHTLWREMNNLPMVADNLSYRAMIYIALARYDEAIAAAQEAYQISVSIGNVWGQSFSQSWVGQAYRSLGHIAQALAAMEDAIRTAVSGFQAPLAFTRSDLAGLYGEMGMRARGIELGEMAHAAARNQAAVMVLWSTSILGHLYLLDGQMARAEELIIQANQGTSTTDQESLFGGANLLAEAKLMLAKNDYARALQACDRLIEYRASHRLRQDLPNVLYVKALALRKNGNENEVWTLLTEARVEAENTNARWIVWRILAELADIESERGQIEQARALRAQAREIIEYIAAHTPPELRASFLNVPDVRALMNVE